MQLAFSIVRDDITTDVLEVVRSVGTDLPEARAESDLVHDLGFDSIRTLELVAALEDRFDINIPLNDLGSVRTVRQIVERVSGVVEARA